MRKTAFQKNCEYCNNQFTTWPGNPKRFCNPTCQYASRNKTPEERLRLCTKRNQNGCLDFIKSPYPNGYGRISIGNGKHQLAHRFAWELYNGPIPVGLCVLHRCDRPICCEISHLFLGTIADNAQDMMQKGRHNTKYGENASHAKLTENQALEIQERLKTGITAKELALYYNVHPETIRGINRGTNWNHIKKEYIKSKPNMPKGSKQYFAKLDENKVKEILIALKSGTKGNQLAKKYGVQRSTIYGIKKGKTWRHVIIDGD